MNPEEKKNMTVEKKIRETEEKEKEFQESVKMQYSCTKYCRCCPFPGLKCVESGHPVR